VASPGRLGFVGRDAPPEIKRLYVGKRLPDEYRKKGAANPIKYTWGKERLMRFVETEPERFLSIKAPE
jgi:hypothetical protein